MALLEPDLELYLRRAAELRELAAATHFPDIKTSLLKIASQYERLAKEKAQGKLN